MKRWLSLTGFIACAVLLLTCSAVMADVKGTHHDMSTFVGGTKDTCYPCHGYKEITYTASLGKIGSLCYSRCHAGGAGAIPTNITIQDAKPEKGTWADNAMSIGTYNMGTAYDTKYSAHGMVNAAMPGTDNSVYNSSPPAWPYAGTGTGARMECTSCHDVHSSTFTPFLRAALSDNTTPANSFCMQCHKSSGAGGRWVIMAADTAPNGAHPVEVGTGGQAWTSDTQRKGRTISLKDPAPGSVGDNAVFRNYTYAGTDLNNKDNHFNPGGKLGNVNQTGNTGVIGCYTCHAVHMPAAAAMSQLTVAPWKMSGTSDARSVMCVGCHGAGDGRNPGTTGYYHPNNGETIVVSISTPANAQYTTTTGFNIYVNVSGTDYSTAGIISCSSCHGDTTSGSLKGVHELANGTFLLNPNKPNCASCHSGTTYSTSTTHHPVGGGTTEGSNWTGAGFRSTINWNSTDNATISNGLSCDDCHVFNGTAHNWN